MDITGCRKASSLVRINSRSRIMDPSQTCLIPQVHYLAIGRTSFPTAHVHLYNFLVFTFNHNISSSLKYAAFAADRRQATCTRHYLLILWVNTFLLFLSKSNNRYMNL